MRFLRMLTNSLLAGALGAAFLTIIVLQLNPNVPLVSGTTWRLFVTLALFYGVHLAVLFYLLMVGGEFIGVYALSPGWVSVRVLAWLAAASAAGAAVLMWLNVSGFSVALDETAARRMTAGAAATAATAIVLLGLAGAHYSFGRRGSRVGAGLLTIAVFGSLALPIAARGPAVAELDGSLAMTMADRATPVSGPRIVMLLLDGASLEYIWPGVAGGRLPNFARILETGASMDLATVRPTGPDPVWAAVATGMYPAKNGVRSPSVYYVRGDTRPLALLPDHCFSHVLVHLGLLRREPNTSRSLRARPLWSILADAGITAGVVRWPLTFPAQQVHGWVVSDRFHQLLGSFQEFDQSAAYPSDVLPVARSAFADAGQTPDWLPSTVTDTGSLSPEASAGLRDQFYSRAIRDLRAALARAVVGGAIPGTRHRRPLQLAVHGTPGRCWRQRRRTSPSPPGDRSLLRLHRQRDRRGHV